MAFSDLAMKTTSEFALQALHKRLMPISEFAHSFNELEDKKGSAIMVPVFNLSAAAEFNAATNNYGDGVNEVDCAQVNLNKHFVKSVAYTDRDLLETEVQFARDYGIAIGDVIGRSVNDYVVGMINATNCPLSAEFNPTAKANFTELFKTAYDNNLDIRDCVLMLNAEYYAKLLSFLDSNVYGATTAIQQGGNIAGKLDNLYGFKSVVCVPNLVSGLKGALCDVNSIGVANRYIAPMAGAYVGAWRASDPINGFTMGFREFADLASGVRYMAGEALVGASVIRPSGIVRLV